MNFNHLRPYSGEEIPAAMKRLAEDPLLLKVAPFAFPEMSVEEVKSLLLSVNTTEEFQHKMMYPAIQAVLDRSISQFSCAGLENLDPQQNYLFISNHRDIVLDSALFEMALFEKGFRSTEITFGENLMKPPFVVDIGKANKMFKVVRRKNTRDDIPHALELSHYIHHCILEKQESVWIAQRDGRTKDGCDATSHALLKMLAMCRKPHFLEAIRELQIVPLSISYQYEPCDYLKARELFLSKEQKYVKSENEDLQSILVGLNDPKGRVHLQVHPSINKEMERMRKMEVREQVMAVADCIDRAICKGFQCFDTHYMAYDIWKGVSTYARFYNAQQRRDFEAYIDQQVLKIRDVQQTNELRNLLLMIYANPLNRQDVSPDAPPNPLY